MNIAQVLALVVSAAASVAIFLLMRYPTMRRPQFQSGRAFSVAASLACAIGTLAVMVALVWLLQS
jgi:hypothetical protein